MYQALRDTESHTSQIREICSTDGATVVDAGSHIVDLHIQDRITAFFGKATVWVLWVGFDGQGLKPTESSIITLDAPTDDDPARQIQDG